MECRNIELEYMRRFGETEYKLQEAYCEYLRLKRMMEMVQAKRNRQEEITIENVREIQTAQCHLARCSILFDYTTKGVPGTVKKFGK